MTGTTHKLGGIMAGSATAILFNANPMASFISIILGIIGATLSDIDKKNTTISNRVPILAFLVRILQKLVIFLTLGLSKEKRKKVKLMTGHRGMTHTLLATAVISTLTFIIALSLKASILNAIMYGFSMMLGILSHIILDLYSGSVPLLIPYSFEKKSWGNIRGRSFKEKLVMLILLPQAITLLYIALI